MRAAHRLAWVIAFTVLALGLPPTIALLSTSTASADRHP
jgi:hypothetical protein